ncbi:hypothetical protein H0194_02655 [Corynebacterium incognita]|uniref:Asparagine synthetase domain-containing protein n=1 Tax=Corynebacterium incognita TaxID=2754725 RepID=A0A7G7CQT5_9CORY|nr:hypothetical protein [Corynebacterium incognita]QNE89951.1 hypothetical protein H0194_02655 [Corynebacterium incognita]
MTIFLLAVPKPDLRGRNTESDLRSLSGDVLRSAFAAYARIVGNHYCAEPKLNHPGSLGRASVLVWKRERETNSVQIKKDWWALSAGQDVAMELIDSVSRIAGTLQYAEPVWGSYVAAFGERHRDRVTLWGTVPAMETAHFGENQDYVFVSNRPMLAALAIANGDVSKVALSEDYLDQYLMLGFSIDKASPFSGVSTLLPDEAVSIRAGEIVIEQAPRGLNPHLPKFHTEEEASERLAAALKSATQRCFRQLNGAPIQLRMSGGKDSRLLLGLTRDAENAVKAVNFGRPGDQEVTVANDLCRSAGVPLFVTAPKPMLGTSTTDKVSLTLRLSDGIPASEPHTSIYEGASPLNSHEGIMLGQWPLMKGGQAKKMNYTAGGIKRALYGQASWMASEDLLTKYRYFIDHWTENTPVSMDLDYLYMFARQFRSGRWLQAHINLFERDAIISYPIADSEVATLSDSLTMAEKISQRVLFLALDRIWPTANRIPLSNNGKWRFEAGGVNSEIGSDTYHQRHAEICDLVEHDGLTIDPNLKYVKPVEYTQRMAKELAAEITVDPGYPFIREKLSPEFREVVSKAAEGEFVIPRGSSQRQIVKYIWRTYVSLTWWNKSWMGLRSDLGE